MYLEGINAVIAGNVELVKKIITSENVNVISDNGRALLITALYAGQKDVVELLLDIGADVNRFNAFGESPLFVAVYMHRKDIVELLLERGADANPICEELRFSPIRVATSFRYWDIVNVLKTHGALYR